MHINLAELKESRFDFVHDSQKTFRTLMMALAFPGKIFHLPVLPLSFSVAEVHCVLQPFLTLLDLETSFAIVADDPRMLDEITRYIELNTNCPLAPCQEADFILCLGTSLYNRFPELKKGRLSSPDNSATVFYLVDRIEEAQFLGSTRLSLAGPGIRTTRNVFISGLDEMEISTWAEQKNDYPLGIDIYLTSRSGDLIGIPRAVKF
ncbi:MAG: phosphonate C-P lyase system protein PhnH [bacterium]|nr:phosphonate C-P lyase system protein PhnH [bacterium]